MPRRTRRDQAPATRRRGQGPRAPRDVEEISGRVLGPTWAQAGGYMVSESVAEKRYRCPYCEGWIDKGVLHVVAYPEGRLDERRHYHSGCWRRKANNVR